MKFKAYKESEREEIRSYLQKTYGLKKHYVKVLLDNCMHFGYAVIKPISDKYPNGVMITANTYRDTVTVVQ